MFNQTPTSPELELGLASAHGWQLAPLAQLLPVVIRITTDGEPGLLGCLAAAACCHLMQEAEGLFGLLHELGAVHRRRETE